MAKAKSTKKKPAEIEEAPAALDPTSLEARRARAVDIAIHQLEASARFKQPRMNEILLNEEINSGKVRPALKNRFNVPFDTVIMQGALDTVLAKSDDSPKLAFDSDQEEYKRSSMKVTAAYDRETADDKGRWASKDRQAKRMAYLSGRAIFEKYTESDPVFKDVLRVEDHFNFHCEPGGGPNLEEHRFLGTTNNFFDKETLKSLGDSGFYDASEVTKLINSDSQEQRKEIQDEFNNVQKRFMALGLDLSAHNYVGQSMFNLVKWEMVFEGERYYLLFDPRTKACLRFVKLTEISPSNRWTWVSWATHEGQVFWSRAYADTYRVCGEIYRVLVNGMLENIQKRNWNMRAYDPGVFTDSAKLLYSPDGLVKANLKPGMTSVSQGIFELQTPDTTSVTLNSMEWLNSFLGQSTGVTPGAQGNSDQAKVGIYYGDMQEVADRFGLLNKQYVQCWIDLGVLFDWGLDACMPEEYMVKVIGIQGAGWEKLTKEDTEPEFTVKVVSTNAQAAETALKAKLKDNAIARITGNPALIAKVNNSWLVEEILRSGSYDDEAIRVGMDVQSDGSREVLLRAAESIRKIVDGKWPVELVFSATTGFQQKIIDYANDHSGELTDKVFHRLMIYAQAHTQIVTENMVRRARLVASQRSAMAPPGGPGGPGGAALPPSMGGGALPAAPAAPTPPGGPVA